MTDLLHSTRRQDSPLAWEREGGLFSSGLLAGRARREGEVRPLGGVEMGASRRFNLCPLPAGGVLACIWEVGGGWAGQHCQAAFPGKLASQVGRQCQEALGSAGKMGRRAVQQRGA